MTSLKTQALTWPWRAAVLVTATHVALAVAVAILADAHKSIYLLLAAFPIFFIFPLGVWCGLRGLRAKSYLAFWWRAQVVYGVALFGNLIISALAVELRFSHLHGDDMAAVAMMWIAPIMWPPMLWPIFALIRWVVIRRSRLA